ncbi:MAG: ComF family protein [Woeseiaceae bacterium]
MILQTLKQHLLPLNCAFCGVRCERHEFGVCVHCLEDMPWREHLITTEETPIDSSIVPFQYAFPVDAALKALKFRRRLDYVPIFSEILWRASRVQLSNVDALLPVPLHWRRHTMRGFNQAIELSRLLSNRSGLPLLTNFARTRATPSQSGLTAQARRHNLQQAFSVRGGCSAQHVLIVDDVITTGATSRELARAVVASGASTVSVLAIART